MPDAFKHMDGMRVPLVYQHDHNSPDNVLGHVKLENRAEGVYAYGYFNSTESGNTAKNLVQHEDLNSLSIYANKLLEKGKSVYHGMIREVSLVLAGANPEALIEHVQLAHGDGSYAELEDEALMMFGAVLEHSDKNIENTVEHADGETFGDIYNSLSEKQKAAVSYLVGLALEKATGKSTQHSDNIGEGDLTHQKGNDDVTNVFEKDKKKDDEKNVLSHDAVKEIVADAVKGGSLKDAVDAYAIKHGIESIETLFPEAKTLNNTPEWNKRRTEWVNGVLNGVRRSPFSRVKSVVADITQDEARAKGYIKGNYKKEEWFGVTKRTTTPTTVYKKQQLDRDDIVDITDFDVVAWLKGEIRLMLEEEIARAILIGDGRDVSDVDKIKDPMAATDGAGIRSIINEHELYMTTVNVNIDDANSTYNEIITSVLRARRYYKGTGMPTFYTTETVLSELLLLTDGQGRDLYPSVQALATKLRVDKIVTVEVMEDVTDLIGVIVNLADYNVGADKGGEVNLFDDFDIDYNQYKYLMETRISGALVKIKSAMVIKKVAATDVLVDPTKPTFVKATGVVTIPTVTGVTYQNADTSATLVAGPQTALAAGETLNVKAVADAGYYFATNAADEWSFTRPAA